MTHTELKKTPLATKCQEAGGKMVDFHGWLLPVQFKGILSEHKAVREDVGMFDVSHMGQLLVEGARAWEFLQHISCNNIKNTISAGTYFHILTEKGTIIDDAIAFCLSQDRFLVVVNAACVDEDYAWFSSHAKDFQVTVYNESEKWSMLAVQGPKAIEKLLPLIPGLENLERFHIQAVSLYSTKGYVTRTGYTGEDGVEILLPNHVVEKLWDELIALGVTPCGLGARDVLRLEAGYLLNGVDADQTRTPYEANCGWVVKLAKENFIGKDALVHQKEQGLTEKLTAFVLKTPGVPRENCPIVVNGVPRGTVSSGTYSPLFKGIAVGYAPANLQVGSEVEIEIHGKLAKAEVVKTPFYKNRV